MLTNTDIITGDKFKLIAEKLDMIYVETHKLGEVLPKLPQPPEEVNIISHRSDGCILSPGQVFKPRPMERNLDFEWCNIPSNIKYWFAQNCDVVDDRLIPIPIGIENDEWTGPQKKKEIIISLTNVEIKKPGLAYLNVNRATNYERPQIYHLFEDEPWCMTEYYKNGDNYTRYARMLRSHKFTFCPEGNGMSTHRPWEALYLGSFPIVRRRVFTTEFAKQLPFLVIDDWKQVTKEFLDRKYEEFSKRKWNYEALKMSWWENLIREKLNA